MGSSRKLSTPRTETLTYKNSRLDWRQCEGEDQELTTSLLGTCESGWPPEAHQLGEGGVPFDGLFAEGNGP